MGGQCVYISTDIFQTQKQYDGLSPTLRVLIGQKNKIRDQSLLKSLSKHQRKHIESISIPFGFVPINKSPEEN